MQPKSEILVSQNESIFKRKKTIAIIIAIMLAIVTTLSSVKAYSIQDVNFVIPFLETDSVWNDICRSIGKFIYDFTGMFLNYAEQGFTSLMKWEIMDLPVVKDIMTKFDVVLYSLLFVAFIGVVMIRMFTFQNGFKTLYNLFMTMMIISCFTVFMGMVSSGKDMLVQETNNIIKGGNNDTMAEKLYKDNTVDIVQSMKKGSIVRLKDIDGVKINLINTSLRIKRGVLNEYYTYSEDGIVEIEELNDGVFGQGDERYYRYRTDYYSVNITIILSIIVFSLAIFKLAYLVYQWFSINFFGKIGLGKGMWDIQHIGKTLKSALNTVGGMVILYFSMMMFSVLCSNILTDSTLDNWFVKAVMVFAIGMAIVVGSGFVNDFLGIDDGSNFALKSVFMAQRMARLGKGVVNGAKGVVGAPLRSMDRGNELLMNAESHFRGNYSTGGNSNGNYGTDVVSNNNGNRQGDSDGRNGVNDTTRDVNKDRQSRFQNYYDKKYDGVDRKKDLYNQSKKNDDFSEVEKGSKDGYTNQIRYRPYVSSNSYKDDEDMDMQDDMGREESMKRGRR